MTKDERYLVKLFELALKRGDLFEEINMYEVGRAMGQNDRSVENIVRMLAQSNFLKKGQGNNVYLTKQGEAYVESLSAK